MAQKLGVEVSADLDTSDVEKKINALGQKIAQANRARFEPISGSSKKDLEDMLRMFEHLRVIQGDLNRRMRATGQENTPVLNADWDKLYVNPAVRARKMREAFQYATGQDLGGGGDGGGGGRQSSLPGMAAGVAQAGLRAAGPAGGVAASALGTGMSAGFGAGLMGLLGGMLALGVGKIVGSAMEKMGQAEDNAVAMDRLKRVLGDVNIAFDGLKSVVHAGADNLKITYAEAGKLATEFSKLGNLTSDQNGQIAEELKTGVGFSRGFGLDPAQGVGIMGQMRGMRVTTDAQESRKFALLIGETIGKSNAFAKANEVMDAIANYATMQTRNGMGVANVAGFAGMYSSMVGSGIPGLDPAGAGSLLMRINASLAAGGAKGESSQFFSNIVGQRMGLNPIQTEILRGGGAFATNDEAFGPGSAAARYGISGPSGNSTWMEESLAELRRQYGHDPGMLAQATANHFGIGIRQAMSILSLSPNDMGGMQAYAGDITKLSGSGIANLSKVVTGSASDRAGVAASFMARDDVSVADKAALRKAMETGDEETQKRVLAELIASKDQERTQGSDIRDSKNALDNIKTNLADKLIPLTLEMRHGIMAIAGVGKDGVTSDDIMRKVLGAESDGRIRSIRGEHDPIVDGLTQRHKEATDEARDITRRFGADSDEAYRARGKLRGIEVLLADAVEKRHKLIQEEEQRLSDSIKALEKESEARRKNEAAIREETERLEKEREERIRSGASTDVLGGSGGRMGRAPYSERWSGTRGSSAPLSGTLEEKLAQADKNAGLPPGTMRSVFMQETSGSSEYIDNPAKYHYPLDKNGRRIAPHTGKVSTAFGPFGILESTARDPGYGVAPLRDKSLDEQIRFASEYLAARTRAAGSLEGGLAGYGEGGRYSGQVMDRIRRHKGTPLPQDAPAERQSQQTEVLVKVEGGEFTLRDQLGLPRADPIPMSTRVYRPAPFGTPNG